MIQVSRRYALALIAMGIAAAVPVLLHTLGRFDRDDCAAPAALRAALLGDESPSVTHEGGDLPGLVQWIEGTVAWGNPPRSPLSFVLARTTDPTRLTRRPYRPVVDELEAIQGELRWVEDGQGGRLPIRWTLDYAGRKARFASYFFAYQGRPVSRPLLALAESAPVSLLNGARPLTLLVVGGSVPTRDVEEAREAADAWLLDAWRNYQRACYP
jgi:hypothetical protein